MCLKYLAICLHLLLVLGNTCNCCGHYSWLPTTDVVTTLGYLQLLWSLTLGYLQLLWSLLLATYNCCGHYSWLPTTAVVTTLSYLQLLWSLLLATYN